MRYSGTLSSPSIDPRSIVNVLIFSIGLKINNAEDAMLVYGTFNKELVKYILKHINSSPVNLVYKNFESEEEAKNFSHSLLSRLSGVDIFGQAGETNVLGQKEACSTCIQLFQEQIIFTKSTDQFLLHLG